MKETWFVSLTEYPDEGSVEVGTETMERALEIGAGMLDTDVGSLTARLGHERELELLREERDRLARELEASQGMEVELRGFVGTIAVVANGAKDLGPVELLVIAERARKLIASPSPPAEAIARVLEAVAIEYESPHLQSHLCEECEADPVVMEAVRAHDETMAAYAALRAIRSGQGEDQPPGEEG